MPAVPLALAPLVAASPGVATITPDHDDDDQPRAPVAVVRSSGVVTFLPRLRLAALVGLLATASLGLTCGPPPPSSDTCAPTAIDAGSIPDASITSLEIGRMENGTFIPFVDGGVAPLTIGGQGSTMLVAYLRVRGSGVPACLPQTTRLQGLDGTEWSSEQAPMKTEPAGAGTWVTGAMFLVYFGESQVQVRLKAQVGSRQTEVVVWTDAVGTVDAGVDAMPDAFAR